MQVKINEDTKTDKIKLRQGDTISSKLFTLSSQKSSE